MGLDPSCVGIETAPHELEYDPRTLALYALGIGARRAELDYLYEARGPRVYPTFAVVPAYAPVVELLGRTGGDLGAMVHGAQTVHALSPIPSAGRLSTTARVTGVYDMKRLAQVLCVTESRVDGAVAFRTEWQLLFLGQGGFGGPHPPRQLPPRAGPDAPLLFEHEEATSPEQALLYRLSGDTNPLHVDPEFAARVGFPEGPILHGLCTYGFIARAVVQHALGGDASRLRSITAQFRKPVWPGETLRTVGHRVGDQIVLKTHAGGREEAVVTGCYADVVW